MKIAMVQFDAAFLKVEENKAKAEMYVAEAVEAHADMREWMAGLSQKNRVIVGGFFLEYEKEEGDIYNTYGLFFPEGQSYFHRKDIPTALEAFCYKGGDECMVFDTPAGRLLLVGIYKRRWRCRKIPEGREPHACQKSTRKPCKGIKTSGISFECMWKI